MFISTLSQVCKKPVFTSMPEVDDLTLRLALCSLPYSAILAMIVQATAAVVNGSGYLGSVCLGTVAALVERAWCTVFLFSTYGSRRATFGCNSSKRGVQRQLLPHYTYTAWSAQSHCFLQCCVIADSLRMIRDWLVVVWCLGSRLPAGPNEVCTTYACVS